MPKALKVLVDGSVETAAPIDEAQLDALATWLCQKDEYCNSLSHNSNPMNINVAYGRFERERESNGGYCNDCRNHAGRILGKFNITEVE